MTGKVFVDTNVLVYARDLTEPEKQPRAAAWMEHLWRAGTGSLSYQVLLEYYVTVTRKLKPGMERQAARNDVRNLMAWHPLPVDDAVIDAAWMVEDRYSVSWWDALIVATAQVAGCPSLLSEDLQDGMEFDGVTVVNPFLHESQKG